MMLSPTLGVKTPWQHDVERVSNLGRDMRKKLLVTVAVLSQHPVHLCWTFDNDVDNTLVNLFPNLKKSNGLALL